MSQGLNNFCSTMLYHQHETILPPYSPARPWRRVHHGNTAFSSFVAAASAAAPCPSSNQTSNGLPSLLQATPAPCSVQYPSRKTLPRHLLAYRRQPPTYPRTYSFVSPSLSGRHSGGAPRRSRQAKTGLAATKPPGEDGTPPTLTQGL